MNDITELYDRATGWLTANQVMAWALGVAAALAVVAVILYEVTRLVRRAAAARAERHGNDDKPRTNIKEIVGYGVVQVGMAYVTITGGYDFWHYVAHMPAFEAGAVAVIVESAQWWFIGRIFRHMRGTHTITKPDGTEATARNEGYGPAGPKFWTSVVGGGVLAVLGAVFAPEGTLSLAVGRAVVVYIGSSMFDLLLREQVYYADAAKKKPRTTFLLTPRRLGVMMGILSPTERDLRHDNREWTVRRMARAIRWVNDGWWLPVWLGKRTLLKSMETGDARLMADATSRYAMGYVLVNEVKASGPRMAGALNAARAVLTPPPAPDAPTPPPAPPKPPVKPPSLPLPPAPKPLPAPQPPAPRADDVVPPSRAATKTRGAAAGHADAAALRDEAVRWAVDQLRNGVRLTAKTVGTQFGSGEEWGRQRLNDARSKIGEVAPAAMNGHDPSA